MYILTGKTFVLDLFVLHARECYVECEMLPNWKRLGYLKSCIHGAPIVMKTVIACQNKENGGLQRRLANKEMGRKLLLRKMEVMLKAARKVKRSKKKCCAWSLVPSCRTLAWWTENWQLPVQNNLQELNFIFLDRKNFASRIKSLSSNDKILLTLSIFTL